MPGIRSLGRERSEATRLLPMLHMMPEPKPGAIERKGAIVNGQEHGPRTGGGSGRLSHTTTA